MIYELVRYVNAFSLVPVAAVVVASYKHLHIPKLKVLTIFIVFNAIAEIVGLITSKLQINNTIIGCLYGCGQMFLIAAYFTNPFLQRKYRPIYLSIAGAVSLGFVLHLISDPLVYPANVTTIMSVFIVVISMHQFIVWFKKGPGLFFEVMVIFSLFTFYLLNIVTFYYSDVMPPSWVKIAWFSEDMFKIATSLLILIALLNYLHGKNFSR